MKRKFSDVPESSDSSDYSEDESTVNTSKKAAYSIFVRKSKEFVLPDYEGYIISHTNWFSLGEKKHIVPGSVDVLYSPLFNRVNIKYSVCVPDTKNNDNIMHFHNITYILARSVYNQNTFVVSRQHNAGKSIIFSKIVTPPGITNEQIWEMFCKYLLEIKYII